MVKRHRDFWEQAEVFSKLIGAIAAVAGAIFIPYFINRYAEESRKAQTYAQIMSQREAKDSDVRTKMFETLLSGYLKISSDRGERKGSSESTIRTASEKWGSKTSSIGPEERSASDIGEFNQKIVFLNLLVENFQEYFNVRYLLGDLYDEISDRIDKCKENKAHTKCSEDILRYLTDCKRKIIALARYATSKQITMLSRVGLVSKRIHIKEGFGSSTYIPLFEIKGEIQKELRLLLGDLRENQSKQVSLFGPSHFSIYEFKGSLEKVENLCEAIRRDGYVPSSLQTKRNSIDWLNELLRVPDFYEILLKKKPNKRFSTGIDLLQEQMKESRKMEFPDLSAEERGGIERLNRLLLEETYPEKTPKVENRNSWWTEKPFIEMIEDSSSLRKHYAIKIAVEKIKSPEAKVSVSLHAYDPGGYRFARILYENLALFQDEKQFFQEYQLVDTPQFNLEEQEPFVFYVSYFDMPYMDNTRLFQGDRFAIVVKGICEKGNIEKSDDCLGIIGEDVNFRVDEFKDSEAIEDLYSKIRRDLGDKNPISKDAEKTIEEKIEWLNKVLEQTNLSEILIGRRPNLMSNDDIQDLQGKTRNCRGKKFSDLSGQEQVEIKRLNRFLLEEKYEDRIPKLAPTPFVIFQVVTFREEFMSLRDRPLFEEILKKME